MPITPQFTLSDIRLTVGDKEYKKGLDLYEKGKVTLLKTDELWEIWSAAVEGTSIYQLKVPAKNWDHGSCDCYIGQRDEVCKHLIAVSIAVVKDYGIKQETIAEDIPLDVACCSSEIREMTPDELESIKIRIREAIKYIRGYDGPSSTWFKYQNHLDKGSRLILATFATLPICQKSVDICISTLKKLDKKICEGGVDDSNGTIGGAMEQIVQLLCLMSDIYAPIVPYILKELPQGQMWDWDKNYRDQYGTPTPQSIS